MGEPHVISALVRKRAQLAGVLAETARLQRTIAKHIAHVDQVLAIVGYRNDPKAIPNRRKNTPSLFKRGQLRRIIYDIRREGPCVTTDRGMAIEVMRRMKWDHADEALLCLVTLKTRDVRKAIGR